MIPRASRFQAGPVEWISTRVSAASTELRKAGSSPFHAVERHIWNHSPPAAMNPPKKSTMIITRPMLESARA